MKRVILGVFALVLVPGVALATPTFPPSKRSTTSYKRTTKMIFKGDTVRASRGVGGGSVVNVRPGAMHSSLIVVRQTFLPELIKSAERF